MKQKPRKRFIAGAICPQCQAQDKLLLLLDGTSQQRECVTCGFTDSLDELGKSDLPQARFDPQSVTATTDTQVLHLEPRPGAKDRK